MTLKTVEVVLDELYVPQKLRDGVDPARVEELAEAILAEGLRVPIEVRADRNRYVLVHGRHRMAALRSLGETTAPALLVHARLA
jgi:ParB-like chromosome segregation protein Spo0J